MTVKKEENCSCCTSFCGNLTKKLFVTLIGIVLVYVIVLLGTMIRNNIQDFYYIGQADKMERTITIDGQGKITAKPDIAVTTMGMISEGKTVSEVQQANTDVMNKLVSELKVLGISGDDLQTVGYSIYPQYKYTEESDRILTGYEVRQDVKIKVRDLDKANQVIALAGKVGANEVGGLEFTIDDDEVYQAEARIKALEKVAAKARALSQSLGVNLVKVVSYNEYVPTNADFSAYKYGEALGLGGGGTAPDIQSGSMEVLMNVAVTFEIQ